MFQIELTARQLCGQGVLVSLDRGVSASGGFGSGVGVVLEEALALTATEAMQRCAPVNFGISILLRSIQIPKYQWLAGVSEIGR